MATPKELLERILNRKDLTANEMEELLDGLAAGTVPAAQAGALLAALRMKGEAVSEVVGGARMMRHHAEFIDCGGMPVVDIVGTGGDGGVSFNISTTSAFVAAGAGVAIAKHGNRAVSGKSGAADVLAALGFNLLCDASAMENSIRENGIGFLFAQKLHPVMGKIAPIRRDLGVRTIFNMLGPLTNPAGARTQLIGVYAPELTEVYAGVFKRLGSTHALIVHGSDGMDEITVTGPSRCSELKDGLIRTYDIDPEPLFGGYAELGELAGGDAKENADIATGILTGKIRGAKRNVVLINAAGTLLAADLVPDLAAGVKKAEESIDSGAAYEKLRRLVEISNS